MYAISWDDISDCGLVMPFGIVEIGQPLIRLMAWCQKTNNVIFSCQFDPQEQTMSYNQI